MNSVKWFLLLPLVFLAVQERAVSSFAVPAVSNPSLSHYVLIAECSFMQRNSYLTRFEVISSKNIAKHHANSRRLVILQSQRRSSEEWSDEAAKLLARAEELRKSLPSEDRELSDDKKPSSIVSQSSHSKMNEEDDSSVGYRLYLDIGREPGTWMDPRWGASGKRIEFTVDVQFLRGTNDDALANKTVAERMNKHRVGGRSSPVYTLKSSENARLRGGFDKMRCYGGGYRIDYEKGSATRASTLRFHLLVDGTPEVGSTYGDIFIPKGCLYFSIPCFGNSISNLSSKEGTVMVRQIGWHTGWRREESRILGTFRAVPIDQARRRDRY